LVLSGTFFVSGDSGGDFAAIQAGAGGSNLTGVSEDQILNEITTEAPRGAAYDGYVIKIKDAAVGGINAGAMKRVADSVIGDEIAVVDDPKDVLKFANAGDIEIIEPNYRYYSLDFPQSDPADPLYTDANNYQWGIKYVNAKAAWAAGYRGQGVNIAILDTGIVKGHEDLNGDKILTEMDWINMDTNAADDNMHGSVVGGIIAADVNNLQLGTTTGVGMAGIADKSNLIIHKVLNSKGAGGEQILYALNDVLEDENRVDVVNLSLGGENYSAIMNDLVQKIIKKGTIVVAATGNNGADTGGTANKMNYPAGYANVIGAGSIGQSGGISNFSTKNKSVDVVAPGELMVGLEYGTSNGYVVNTFYEPGYGTVPLSGTSFSAPIIAAAAAIAKQRDKSIDAGAFLTALKRTSRDAGAKGYDTSYGNGILDINKLVAYLDTKSVTVTFDANGGKVGKKSKLAWPGGKYGTLPVPTRSKTGFGGWYTKKKGGTKVTSLSRMASSNITLYAHWQAGTTLADLAASKGKFSPVFAYKKTSYKLTLSKKETATKITPAKSYNAAKMQIKIGSGKYKKKSSVTVKLKKGKSTTVYIKLTKKGMKTKTYKIKVKRKK
jgi:subtilisin family serine protease